MLVKIILIILIIIGIILPILYVHKLENLDDCSCVNDWRKNLFRYGGIAILLLELFLHFSDAQKKIITRSTRALIVILSIFIYLVISLTYLSNLKNCQCSKEKSKSFINFLYVIFIILSIILIFSVLASSRERNPSSREINL
jgi:hypothetical protein